MLYIYIYLALYVDNNVNYYRCARAKILLPVSKINNMPSKTHVYPLTVTKEITEIC